MSFFASHPNPAHLGKRHFTIGLQPYKLGFISLRRGLDKMDFDLKIVGGTIVDGSGRESYRGDVGILDGRIVALGEIKGDAARTLDAGDLVVSAGFVDFYTQANSALQALSQLSFTN